MPDRPDIRKEFAAAYARWRAAGLQSANAGRPVDQDLLTNALDEIEQHERAILTALGCPTDDVSVYAILTGKHPAPWPKKTAARDQANSGARSTRGALAVSARPRSRRSAAPRIHGSNA